jgi:hypothetical protein
MLGNVLPGQLVKVRITTVAVLRAVGPAVEVFIPSFVAPRYTPAGSTVKAAASTPGFDAQCPLSISVDVQMASPITDITSTTHTIQTTVGGADVSANPNPPPPRHSAATVTTAMPNTAATVQLAPGTTFLDKDFTISITTADPHQPRAWLERSAITGTTAALITLVPQLEFTDCKCEFVFVVDRSGSMQGRGIQHAKAALTLFLRSLPEDCYFNICGFGSRHELLFQKPTKLSSKSLATATQHVTNLQANLGGTSLLPPLLEVLSQRSVSGYARQVFVLTDGQVSNTQEVITAVGRERAARCFSLGLGHGCSRDLVDGIARAGRGTAEYVLDTGAGNVGGAGGNHKLEEAVIGQLKRAMQPALTDTAVVWPKPPPQATSSTPTASSPAAAEVHHHVICDVCGMAPLIGVRHQLNGVDYDLCDEDFAQLHPTEQQKYLVKEAPKSLLAYKSPAVAAVQSPPGVRQAPFNVPPIFSGEQFTVYAVFDDAAAAAAAASGHVVVTSQTPDGPLQLALPVTVCDDAGVTGGIGLLHTLAGRAMIQDLEDGKSYLHDTGRHPNPGEVKAEIVRLGTTYGLVSQHTSYVATQPPPPPPPLQGQERFRCLGGNMQMQSAMKSSNSSYGGRDRGAVGGRNLTQSIMANNISSVMSRGASLDCLVSQSMDLSSHSKSFCKSAKKGGSMFGGMFDFFGGSSSPSASPSRSKSSKKQLKLSGSPAPPPPAMAARAPLPPAPFPTRCDSSSMLHHNAPCAPPAHAISKGQVAAMKEIALDVGAEVRSQNSLLNELDSRLEPTSAPPSTQSLMNSLSTRRMVLMSDASSDEDDDDNSCNSYEMVQENADLNDLVDLGTKKKKSKKQPTPSKQQPSRPQGGDLLQDLVVLQEFNGEFPLNETLASIVGIPLATITAAMDAWVNGGAVQAWFGVVIAIAFFRTQLTTRKSEWELVEAKSVRWLAKNIAAAQLEVTMLDEMVAAGSALF